MSCTYRSSWAVLLGAVLLGCPLGARSDEADPPKDKLTPEQVSKAEKAVKAHLEKIKGDYATIKQIKDDNLERALPGYAFFGVLYRQYPVGRVPPAGLKVANVFAVQDDKLEALTDMKGLETYFKTHLRPAASDEKLKDAVRAWLAVAQELRQDGFFKFKLEDDSTKVMNNDKGKIAVGKLVIMGGGNGQISGRLIFNMAGKLTEVSEDSKITPGPRPICHATKLLDADPLVRRIVEQDLLIMGRAAKPYLDEQRAKATPELRKAIDALWKRIEELDRD